MICSNRTTPVMPFGAHRQQPLTTVPTDYLFWSLGQAGIRFKYRQFVQDALAELANRLRDPAAIVDEITPKAPPPKFWKLKENIAAARQASKEAAEASPPPAPGGQFLDAYEVVRQHRQQRQALQQAIEDLL